jgi:hypothetical protein
MHQRCAATSSRSGYATWTCPSERPAKDTETVLRYKLGLIAGGVRYPTKIEVSYRGEAPASWATLSRPLSEVVDLYISVGTTYPQVGHYGRTPAVWQKIAALALRSEVQARDVFDLNVLLGEELDARLPHVDLALLRGHLSNQVLHEAATRALDISHDQFEDQVAAFRSDARARYGAQWDAMQVRVASFIERLEQQPKSNGQSRGARP